MDLVLVTLANCAECPEFVGLGKAVDLDLGRRDEVLAAMPEGLERDISPREMADLITYIRGKLPMKAP